MKIRILVCLALLIVLSGPVYAFAAESQNPVIEKANDAFDNGNYKLAIELYEKELAREPGNLNVLFWAAAAAQAIENYEKEIWFLKKLKSGDLNRLKARERLVQAYQRVKDFKSLKSERDDLFALFHKHKAAIYKDKKYYTRDKFKAGSFTVVALEYYELKGKFAKRYYFYGQHKRDNSPFVVSLGSYPWVTELERELGNIAKDQRIYHLDGYDGNFHYTFAFYETEPGYDAIKKSATAIYEKNNPGEMAMSSSIFKGGLNP